MSSTGSGAAESAEPLCLRFVNTVGWRLGARPEEHLLDYANLIDWGERAEALSAAEAAELRAQAATQAQPAEAAFTQAIALREALYRILVAATLQAAPDAADLALFNRALGPTLARLQLTATGSAYEWHWGGERRVWDAMLWPVLRSAAELLTSEQLGRVRQCADEACGWLFLDVSRNRSRRWCSMQDCGNRAKARRHYRRQRAQLGN